jgi:hypothetical protein
VAPRLRARIGDLIRAHRWATEQVLFVDRIHEPDPDSPDDLPDWNLGINPGLDHIPRCPEWFADIRALLEGLSELRAETGRDFVLFLAYRSRPELQEHLVFVNHKPVDLLWLRRAIERLV